jgi:hypothetical protein
MGEKYQCGYYVTKVLGGGLVTTDVTSPPRNKCGSRNAETIQIYLLKVKAAPSTGMDRPRGFQEVEGPRISRQSAHEGGKVVSPTHCICLPANLKRHRYKK